MRFMSTRAVLWFQPMKMTRGQYNGLMKAIDGYEASHGGIEGLREAIASGVEVFPSAPDRNPISWEQLPGHDVWRSQNNGAYDIAVSSGAFCLYTARYLVTGEVLADRVGFNEATAACERHSASIDLEYLEYLALTSRQDA